MFCNEFILSDLRLFENCEKVLKDCDHCFNLAADMGGMGFIQSNHSVIFYNNIMISFNIMEACRVKGITRCVLSPATFSPRLGEHARVLTHRTARHRTALPHESNLASR